jgi:hypothetical protein
LRRPAERAPLERRDGDPRERDATPVRLEPRHSDSADAAARRSADANYPGRRFGIRVTEDAMKTAAITVFDPPPTMWFAERDDAQEFCDRLNAKLGYSRFSLCDLS